MWVGFTPTPILISKFLASKKERYVAETKIYYADSYWIGVGVNSTELVIYILGYVM